MPHLVNPTGTEMCSKVDSMMPNQPKPVKSFPQIPAPSKTQSLFEDNSSNSS